jgi:hypothetical protein
VRKKSKVKVIKRTRTVFEGEREWGFESEAKTEKETDKQYDTAIASGSYNAASPCSRSDENNRL